MVCERWYMSKLSVKDGVGQSVVYENWCVLKL
jgi:hypothetical protein